MSLLEPGSVADMRAAVIEVLHGTATISEVIGVVVIVAGTVAITPSFQSLGILGLIVAIRTLPSFSLEAEIEGRWPWRRHESGEASQDR